MILIDELAIRLCVFGRYLHRLSLTFCCCTQPIPSLHLWLWRSFLLSRSIFPAIWPNTHPAYPAKSWSQGLYPKTGRSWDRWYREWCHPSQKWRLNSWEHTMLILLARPFILFGLADHEFGEVPVAYILGGALWEEIDVILIVFELVLFLELLFLLLLLLGDAHLLEVPVTPLVGVYVLVILLYPRKGLLLGHLYFSVVILHQL